VRQLIQYLYFVFFIVVAMSALTIFATIKVKKKKPKLKLNRYDKTKNYIKETINQNQIEEDFKRAGLSIKPYAYQTFRYMFLLASIVLTVGNYQIHQDLSLQLLVIPVMLFLILTPVERVGDKKTPYQMILDMLSKNHKQKLDYELYRTILQFKNLAIARSKNSITSLYALEMLNKHTVKTKPYFNILISHWIKGEQEAGKKYFIHAIGTELADSFISMVEKVDDLEPHELKEQLVMFQSKFMKKRERIKKNKNEAKSYLIYTFVIISALIVMTNFIVVAYWNEAKTLMDLM